MFEINFDFNTKDNKIDTGFYEKLDITNINDADDMDFCYDLFWGDAFLKSDTGELKLNWGWLPLLDFSCALLHIYIDIFKTGGHNKQDFQFTDTDGEIYFERLGNLIKISTSYSAENLSVEVNEFRVEIRNFFVMITDRIKFEFPEVIENKYFLSLLEILNDFDKLNSANTTSNVQKDHL